MPGEKPTKEKILSPKEILNSKIKGMDVEIRGELTSEYAHILTSDALQFVARLVKRFRPRLKELLRAREERQKRIDAGEFPRFLTDTAEIRSSDWTVAELPGDLLDRRVEITGPVDRKMIINALNSGANVYMADFEDSNSPTWSNNIQGQINLRDAVERTITYTSPEGKRYELNEKTAVLFVRPRGWHLVEKNVLMAGEPIPAGLMDFGLYIFHNAKRLIARGTGPYFYLPKMQSHLEARLWNDVFVFTESELGIPRGTIKATVLIEHILASFEMDEILYELRDHSAGLNCGRWDYIFSFIKTFRNHKEFLLPDRSQVTMDRAFLKAYVELLIKTCHRRRVHAMGGMAAQIPIKNDPGMNEKAMQKVRDDKVREVNAGHDGTWVAHPGLVELAKDVFDEIMKTPNQISMTRADVMVGERDLLKIPEGSITEEGLRINIKVGIMYLAAWLGGEGSVPILNLMEDTATAEICRSQIWQWIRHGAAIKDGRIITPDLFKTLLGEESLKIKEEIGEENFTALNYPKAAEIFEHITLDRHFIEFLTLETYKYL
jgi:malate synthase